MDPHNIINSDIRLETDRLILRKINFRDALNIFEYTQKIHVTKATDIETHKTIQDTLIFIHSTIEGYSSLKSLILTVQHKQDNKVIGTCGFTSLFFNDDRAMVEYTISDKYWGRGYATEAVKKILDFGFNQLNFHRIEAVVEPTNIKSKRVLEKMSMKYEGTLKEVWKKDNKYRDLDSYYILKGNLCI